VSIGSHSFRDLRCGAGFQVERPRHASNIRWGVAATGGECAGDFVSLVGRESVTLVARNTGQKR